jgi:transposase InsO family protein
MMSDEKIRKVVEFPRPRTPRQLKQFLGLVNYFRAHVRNFAVTAVPLHEMTEGYNNEPKTRSKPLQWTDESIAAFESIKDAIRANPLLHFLDEQLPVSVATDASDYGIGAYLYQTRIGEDGQEEQIPIAFLSQAMTKVQRRWSTIEKECYAIWYALRKWEHLLRDIPFTIYTDHRNLKYLNTNTPKVVRWKLAIQEFDFKVRHIDGEANVVADAFSRLCAQDGEEEEVAFDGTSSGTRACEDDEFPDRLCSLTGVCSCAPAEESTAYLCGIVTNGPLGNVTPTAPLHTSQPRSRIVRKQRRTRRPTSNSLETASSSDAMNVDEPNHQQEDIPQQDNDDGGDDEEKKDDSSSDQPVVVQNLHNIDIDNVHVQYIKEVHNEMEGHMGFHLTMKRLKEKSRSWPFMRRDVRKFISECPICQALRRLTPAIKALPYVTAAPAPMERISIDTMGPYTKSTRGYEYILVVIDNFSRFVELYPLTSVGASEAAERLLEFASRYGQPLQILSDGGTQFLNDTVQELCKLLQVNTIVATPYSKQENGIVERANKEVLRHLRAFLADSKILESWSSYLPLIQRIMNSTPHRATGVPPAAILFGDATRLDRRVLLEDLPNENYDARTGEPLPPRDDMSPTLRAWIDRMLAAQHRIVQIAKQNQEEEQQRHVRTHTPEETPIIFQPNEYVMCEYPDTAFGKQPPNKLLTPLRGPFRVVAYNPLRRQYELQHLNINKTFKIDPSKVHKFNYNPARTDPAEVALRDKQEFYVRAIHGVKGNPKRRKTLQFLVEWEGYDERTWEPWSHLRHNTVLHQYLRNHPTRDLRKLSTIRDDNN